MRRSLMAVILMALVLGVCGGDDGDPASTLEGYTAAYNAGDIDELMTFFSEESVMTGHPFDASPLFVDIALFDDAVA